MRIGCWTADFCSRVLFSFTKFEFVLAKTEVVEYCHPIRRYGKTLPRERCASHQLDPDVHPWRFQRAL
jgi:hypothetical protein